MKNMNLVFVVAIALFAGMCAAQSVSPSPMPSTVILPVATEAPSWLASLVVHFPKLMGLLFVVGALRLTLKPLFAFGHQVFNAWGLVAWDQKETAVEQSKFMKGLFFVLDYLGSIKVPVAQQPDTVTMQPPQDPPKAS